jgi:WD40 repeat protein
VIHQSQHRVVTVDGWAYSASGLFQAGIHGELIQIHDFASDKSIEFAHGYKKIKQLTVSTGGHFLLTNGPDEPIKVWESSTGKLVYINRHQPVDSVLWAFSFYPEVLSANGKRLLRGRAKSNMYEIEIWDVEHDRRVCSFQTKSGVLDTFRFTPNGAYLAGAEDQIVRIWASDTGNEVCTLRGHAERVHQVAFSADTRRLVSSSWDKSVRVWALEFEEQ